MNRKEEQFRLFTGLGALLGPVQKVAENPSGFDADEKTRIIARYFSDATAFSKQCYHFFHSEPGHRYAAQWTEYLNYHHNLEGRLRTNSEKVATFLPGFYESFLRVIASVPVPVESAIHDAATPFSTYCLLNQICSTATQQVIWLDRYFNHTVFHRFVAEAPRSTLVTLVTWPRSKFTSSRDLRRYDELMDISKLFASERGIGGYRLLTDENFHARYLQVDSTLFQLGDSISALGQGATFTLSKLESSTENLGQVASVLATATEVFGVSQPVHL